jgi:hypothetical protein
MRPLVTPSAIRLTALRTELMRSDVPGGGASREILRRDRSPDRWFAGALGRFQLGGRTTRAQAAPTRAPG